MYKKCATEASVVRQRQLEEGLLTAMNTRCYDEITVSELCAEMGVPRKTFYRYFSGKEGALHALIDHTIQDFEIRYIPTMLAENCGFRQAVAQCFQFWLEKKTLLDALARSGLSGVLIERVITYAVEGTESTNRLLLPEHRHQKKEALIFAVCGLMSMVVRWHQDGFSMDVDSMAKLAANLMTHPLYSELA